MPQIGAPAAWEAGLTGTGVTVAVLDTGVDATHPDLAGRVAEARNFSETPEATDTVGHGTHVASIIAGSGAASDGRYRGVAPDATLLIGKVCESDWLRRLGDPRRHAVGRGEQRAAVINMSLGGDRHPGDRSARGGGQHPDRPDRHALRRRRRQRRRLTARSARRPAPTPRSPSARSTATTSWPTSPAAARASATTRLKPDITAPGVEIVAARAADGVIGDPVGEGYVALSGTSMATPHVAGVGGAAGPAAPGLDGRAAQGAR